MRFVLSALFFSQAICIPMRHLDLFRFRHLDRCGEISRRKAEKRHFFLNSTLSIDICPSLFYNEDE